MGWHVKYGGMEAIKKRIAQMMHATYAANGPEVRVGVPDSATEPDGTKLTTVAAANEFGVPGHIPARPFLATGIRNGKKELTAINKASLTQFIKGKTDIRTALGNLGNAAVGKVQEQIRNGSYTPLNPETIKRKGSSKPLIDTGNLIQSIAYEVRGKTINSGDGTK